MRLKRVTHGLDWDYFVVGTKIDIEYAQTYHGGVDSRDSYTIYFGGKRTPDGLENGNQLGRFSVPSSACSEKEYDQKVLKAFLKKMKKYELSDGKFGIVFFDEKKL